MRSQRFDKQKRHVGRYRGCEILIYHTANHIDVCHRFFMFRNQPTSAVWKTLSRCACFRRRLRKEPPSLVQSNDAKQHLAYFHQRTEFSHAAELSVPARLTELVGARVMTKGELSRSSWSLLKSAPEVLVQSDDLCQMSLC